MLYCIKEFEQFKIGDKLPSLPTSVVQVLLKKELVAYRDPKYKDGEIPVRANVKDYIERNKKKPKKNYKRKIRKKKD
ncbi:MAG: hypothetical protein DRI97_09600 [Bacteroidetes bacterium]|nr:MAG: hypothetical protein DRQ78_04685 [Campylobacterota bacterium]RLD55382.1 MAG: hypothetical protein DRI97_09600 [Bacteroidota bacterium]